MKKNALRIFWRILRSTAEQMQKAQLLMVASSLAYTTILSIIPILAVIFSIFQAFGGMQKLYDILDPFILANLADDTSEEVVEALHRFIDNAHAGVVGAGGMIGLIFTSMSMLFSIEKAVNLTWHVTMHRRFLQRLSTFWMLITLGPLALSVLLGIATSTPIPFRNFLPNGAGMLFLNVALFFCLYKFAPHIRVKTRYALISALIMAPLWNLVRIGYVLYTKNVLTYHTVYGSLSAIPLLLIWIYLMWVIVLTGAALTAVLQKTELKP